MTDEEIYNKHRSKCGSMTCIDNKRCSMVLIELAREDERKGQRDNSDENCIAHYNDGKEEGRKETAKEMLNFIENTFMVHWLSNERLRVYDELKKKFGVGD